VLIRVFYEFQVEDVKNLNAARVAPYLGLYEMSLYELWLYKLPRHHVYSSFYWVWLKTVINLYLQRFIFFVKARLDYDKIGLS
jgi:hypothetical protein